MHKASIIAPAGAPLNIDNVISKFADLDEQQKKLASLIIVGKENTITVQMRMSPQGARASMRWLFHRLEIPLYDTMIRRMCVRAAGLKIMGRDDEAAEILRVISKATLKARPRYEYHVKKVAETPALRKQPRPRNDPLVDEMLACQPSLRAFAISLSGNADRADDLVQETFLRALANLDSFLPGSNMPAWLFTILRNLFRSDYRKRRREVEDADGSYAKTLKTQPNQVGSLEFQEFREALDKLPHDKREALILVGASGFSYEDAAAICGCAVGTVKSRLNRARMKIKALLGLDEFEPFESGLDESFHAVLGKK